MPTSRNCLECHADISTTPEFYTTCGSCFPAYAEKNMRACMDCGKFRINNSAPAWKNRCATCYKLGSQKLWRVCTKCDSADIHPLSASWRDQCTPCYLTSKGKDAPTIEAARAKLKLDKARAAITVV